MKIAFGLDMLEMSTVRYRIIDETVSGKYVVQEQSFLGQWGWVDAPVGLMLFPKEKLQIQEEE